MLSMSNASSFLGTKLPNAYITQALIQQGTTIINPTMDIHYGDGVIIKQENLNGTTELVQATNNSSTSQGSADSMCTVTITIYDRVDEHGETYWANKDFSKNIKLKVLQSTNPEFTSKARANSHYSDAKFYSQFSGITVQERTLLLSEEESSQPAVTCTVNGHPALKYLFTFDFILEGGYSSDLAYFACTYIDMEALAAEFDMSTSPNSVRYYMSSVNYQIVYDGNRLTSTKNVIDKTFRGTGGVLERLGLKSSTAAGNKG
jgi:hypothetical protein